MGILGVTETSESRLSTLVADDVHIQKEITLSASAGALLRGTILTLDGTTFKWSQVAIGGTGYAILLEDAGSATREEKAQAYFVGKYRYDDLIFPTGATRLQEDAIQLTLQDRGIIVDGRDFSTGLTTTTTTTSTTSSTTSSSTTTTTTTTAP